MNKIRELRTSKKMYQKDLAKIMNVQQATISSWEVDNSQPSFDMLIKLANFFDVSTDYLIGRTDEIEKTTIQNEINSEEKHILNLFGKLDNIQKGKAEGYISRMIEENNIKLKDKYANKI